MKSYKAFSAENTLLGTLIPTCVQLPNLIYYPYHTRRFLYRLLPSNRSLPFFILCYGKEGYAKVFSDEQCLSRYIKSNKISKPYIEKVRWLTTPKNDREDIHTNGVTVVTLKVMDEEGNLTYLNMQFDSRYMETATVATNSITNSKTSLIVLAVSLSLFCAAAILRLFTQN